MDIDKDTLDRTSGIVLIVVALGLVTVLVLYSRRIIERIARSKSRSAREIARDLRRDE
jgi:hypothetical protein